MGIALESRRLDQLERAITSSPGAGGTHSGAAWLFALPPLSVLRCSRRCLLQRAPLLLFECSGEVPYHAALLGTHRVPVACSANQERRPQVITVLPTSRRCPAADAVRTLKYALEVSQKLVVSRDFRNQVCACSVH